MRGIPPRPGHPLVIGRFLIPTDDHLYGQIAEIRIWDGAKASYTPQYEGKALTGAEPGLIACWTFEEGRGQIAHDISPNANHARLGRSVEADDADPAWIDLHVGGSAPREVSGQVLDPNGEPVAGAQVVLGAEGKGVRILADGLERQNLASRPSIVTTDDQGRFAFSEVPPEYVLVAAHKTGFAQVEVHAPVVSQILRLEPWGRVEGTLYIGRHAAEDQVVMLMSFVGQGPASWVNMARTAVTTAGGRFVFETVPPGWLQIGLRAEMGRRYPGWTSRRSIRVPAGQTLEVTVGGTGRPVVGKFVPPRGYAKPVDFTWGTRVLTPVSPEVPASVRSDEMSRSEQRPWWQTPVGRTWLDSIQHDPDRRLYAFTIEQDGTFRIEDVVPGKYEFTVLLTKEKYHEGPDDYMASFRGAMEMPQMAQEYTDEPLDLGELVLEMRSPPSPSESL